MSLHSCRSLLLAGLWLMLVALAAGADPHERQDSLIGKKASDFPKSLWLNSRPLDWNDLAGKTVILHFFAEWCESCRNDLPLMVELYGDRKSSGIVVIGIHTPGSTQDDIDELFDKFEIQYPVCIDAEPQTKGNFYGQLSQWYGVGALPHAFLIDSEGHIAAHGQLRELVANARELAGESKK